MTNTEETPQLQAMSATVRFGLSGWRRMTLADAWQELAAKGYAPDPAMPVIRTKGARGLHETHLTQYRHTGTRALAYLRVHYAM
jgi:hypothetical protein